MKKSTSRLQSSIVATFGFMLLALFAYLTFALPSVTFQPPTLSDNATTGLNWVFVNVTSTEDLNQSLLEWGNTSGFTNVSMTNVSGMRDWYQNMTDLADGTYNYTVWAENATGEWNQTGRRFVYIDTTPSYSLYACQDLTIENGSYVLVQNVSSSGTCFTIKANGIVLDGQGYSINYSRSVTGYAINNSDNNNGYDNVTIKNLNIVQGNASVQNARGIYVRGMTNSTIHNNTIITSGQGSDAIYLDTASNANNFTDNIMLANGPTAYGINIYFSNNNRVTGGSVISKISNDYYLRGAGSTNEFTNTNFTVARKIQFYYGPDWFNYNNQTGGSIWLKTNVSTASTLTRTIVTWSNITVKWNDTNSSGTGIISNYNLTGLLPNTNYSVYNTSMGTQTKTYTLLTDAGGSLQFNLSLNGNTEIKVATPQPPSYSLNSTNSTVAGTSVLHSLYWTADNNLSAFIFSFDNCTGSFVNETYVFTGAGNWSNTTKAINSTVGCTIQWKVYANDTLGNVTESSTYSYTTTLNLPAYSNIGVNNTIANRSTMFYAYWTSDSGLSGFILSTNNSGTWQNESWQLMTGTGNWSNYTKTLNDTAGLSIGYRFYVNDTANYWGTTSISTLFTDEGVPQISFISPTSGNNSNQTGGTVTINVTIAESYPDTLIFNWNGTNVTYNYSGTFWNITKNADERYFSTNNPAGLRDGTYTYYVWVNDTNGYSNQTETRTLTINGTDGIQAAIDALPSGGGTVQLESRTYSINNTIYMDKANVTLNGTSSSILMFQPHNNASNGDNNAVYIKLSDCTSCLVDGFKIRTNFTWSDGAGRAIHVWNSSNTVIQNMDIDVGTIAGILFNQKGGGGWWNTTNFTLRNNNIQNSSVSLAYVYDSLVENNTITRAYRTFGLDLNSYTQRTRVYNNTVTNSGNGNLKTYIGNDHNIFENNTLINGEYGFELYLGPYDSIFRNNRIYGASKAGIYIVPQYAMYNISVSNNIIYNNKWGILGEYISGAGSYANVTIKNNVIFNNTQHGVLLNYSAITLNVSNNIITNNSGYGIYFVNGTLNESYNDVWGNVNGSYNGTSAGTGDISLDPLFANASAGDFHLKSQAGRWNGTAWVTDAQTSPAIDSGDPADDYSQEPEPNGDRINMGVYGGTSEASKTFSISCPQVTATNDTIYVYGNCATNLTTISSTLNNQTLLNQTSAKQWFLNANLFVNDTNTTLYINSTDVDYLKINSTTTDDIHYIQNNGTMLIDSVEISSWNSTSNTVDARGLTTTDRNKERSYVVTYGGNINVTSSNIHDLGYNSAGETHGFVLYSSSNNYITNNTFSESQDGIKLKENSNNNTIYSNRFIDNQFTGVHLKTSNSYNNISNNYFSGTGAEYDGQTIYLEGSNLNNTIANNLIVNTSGVGNAIRLYSGANSNLIHNNTILDANYIGILLFDAHNNTFINNSINSTGREGIYLTGSGGSLGSNYNQFIENIVTFSSRNALVIQQRSIQNNFTNNIFNGSGTNYPLIFESNAINTRYNNSYVISNNDTMYYSRNATNIQFSSDELQELSKADISNVTILTDNSYFREITFSNITSELSGHYNLSLVPLLSSVNIIINQYNTSTNVYNFTISSDTAENPTNITFQTTALSKQFNIKRNGTQYNKTTSDSAGWINYTYSNATGTEWSGWEFVFEQSASLASCADLSTANTYYTLTQNVSSSGTCFNVLANNVTLDGAGYTVNYSQTTTGYGVNNSGGYDNITIKNLIIIQTNSSVGNKHAIYASGMIDSTIENNTLNIADDYSSATNDIYLIGGSSNIIANNTIISGAYSRGIWFYYSNSNNVSNNTIITSGSNIAIWLYSSVTNTITNNAIIASGYNGYGIYLNVLSNSNIISNNTINTSGSNGYGIGFDESRTNTILNNTIITTGMYGHGIYFHASNLSVISNNRITTSNTSTYGVYLYKSLSYSPSDSNTVSNNTIKTMGNGSYAIHLYSATNSTIVGNVMNTTNAYAIYFNATMDGSYYNHTIDTTNTEQGEPIYYYFANSSIVIENLTNVGQLYVANSTNITIRNVTLDKDGIVLAMTTSSAIINSNISPSGSHGIYLYSFSNSNTISNSNVSVHGASAYGIYIDSSGTNNISGVSIISNQSYDYYLSSASTTNNFTNTNFTASRKIYFNDATSHFNYNNETNGNIWLKTNVSAQSYLIRTLANWTQLQMRWNDTNSTAGITARYSLSGMVPNGNYYIYTRINTTQSNPYNKTADSSGSISAFTVALNGNTEINISKAPPTITINSPTNGASLSVGTTLSLVNITTNEAATCRYNLTNSSFNYPDEGTLFDVTGSLEHLFNYTDMSDGQAYTLYYKCNDTYGNINAISISHTFSVSSPAAEDDDGTGGDPVGGGNTTSNSVTLTGSGTLIKASVTLKAALSNPSITSTELSSVPVDTPSDIVYQYLEITKTNFENSDIQNATIEFKVNKSWIDDNNISTVYLARYDSSWVKLTTDIKSTDSNYNTYLAYTDGFSYFAIAGEKTQQPLGAVEPVLDTNLTSADGNNTNLNASGQDSADISKSKTGPVIIAVLVAALLIGGAYYLYNYYGTGKSPKTAPRQPAPAAPDGTASTPAVEDSLDSLRSIFGEVRRDSPEQNEQSNLSLQPKSDDSEKQNSGETSNRQSKTMEDTTENQSLQISDNDETDYLIKRLKEIREKREQNE